MGAWGTGLYDDDVAADVKADYTEFLENCTDTRAADREFIEENEDFIEDEDDAPIFWFALADTQWDMGRLTPTVKKRALSAIETNLQRWRDEADEEAVAERKKVLDELAEKLNSPQPPKKKKPKKTPKQRRKLGNVYAIPLPDGKFAFCREFYSSSIAVYKHIGSSETDLPETEEYSFFADVYYNVLTCGEWKKVDYRPFGENENIYAPPVYIWDIGTGKYSIMIKGEIYPATKAECKDLEEQGVCAANHVIDRITGANNWQDHTREYCYIERFGQEAFDKFTENS